MRLPDPYFPSILMPIRLYICICYQIIFIFLLDVPVELLVGVDMFQVHTPAINNHSQHFPAVEYMELQ